MSMIEIIVTIVCSILASNGLWAFISTRSKKKSNESKLLMGIAYSKIIQQGESYIARGYVSIDEYNELNRYLYEPYHAMGGNGTAEIIMEKVAALPSEPRREEPV